MISIAIYLDNLVVLEAIKDKNHLSLTVGTDDPSDLEKEKTKEKIWRYAFINNYWFLSDVGKIELNG